MHQLPHGAEVRRRAQHARRDRARDRPHGRDARRAASREEDTAKIHASLELFRCSQCHGTDQLRQLAIIVPGDRMRIVRADDRQARLAHHARRGGANPASGTNRWWDSDGDAPHSQWSRHGREHAGDGEAAADEIAARLHALIGQPQVSEAYVRFRLDLLAAQQAARRGLVGAVTPTPQPETPPAAPLPLALPDVAFPPNLLGTLLQAIRAAAAAHGRETEDIQRLTAARRPTPTCSRPSPPPPPSGRPGSVGVPGAPVAGIYVDALLFVGRTLASPCVAEAVRVCTRRCAVWQVRRTRLTVSRLQAPPRASRGSGARMAFAS